MIIARTVMDVLPDKRKEVMQTLLSMIDAVGKENGCLSYNVSMDIELNTVFRIFEEWKTREDLERHLRSERYGALLGTKSLLAKPMELKIHTVYRSEGNDAVNILRTKQRKE
ncbi:MAG: antibiotic biosynthesis monooxygenase [Deltaproteobacteria bacterium]|nr:antibiotic biosynthesis monooxygenase [Deltaproteobacteria bacterium]